MQIDTAPHTAAPVAAPTSPAPLHRSSVPSRQPDDVISDIISILATSLHQFIRRQTSRALGPEYVEHFVASLRPSPRDVLDFLHQHWISIFRDSSISALRSTIDRLRRTIRTTPRRPNGRLLVPSQTTAHELARDTEAVLQATAPTQAARVADLRLALPPLRSSTSPSSPSPPPRMRSHIRPVNINPQPPRGQFTTTSPSMVPPSAVETILPPLDLDPSLTAYARGARFVLDGSNIAWRHGAMERFSITGAYLALHHFLARGHETVLFLPEPRLRSPLRESDTEAFNRVCTLKGSSLLVLTPESEYDDSYVCAYARRHAAVVVSNDRFQDFVHQASADGEDSARDWATWFDSCRLGFTFCRDEFLPFANFNWQRAAEVANRLCAFQ